MICADPSDYAYWVRIREMLPTSGSIPGMSAADIARAFFNGHMVFHLAQGSLLITTRPTSAWPVIDIVYYRSTDGWDRDWRWLKEHARAVGATTIRAFGRRGWPRVIEGAKPMHAWSYAVPDADATSAAHAA